MQKMTKLVRTSTIPGSMITFCQGLFGKLKTLGYDVVAISSPGQRLQDLAEQEQVRVVGVPMQRRISPLKDIQSLWQMWRALRREKPDMVHSMTPKAGMVTMVAACLARVPVRIHTFTGLVFPTSTGLKRRILMATDWLTCACATHIIPEGEGVKADLLDNGITRKPLRVLGHGNVRGIDLEHWAPLPKDANTPDHHDYTFVFVGRLVRDKGVNELIGAFKQLHSEHPHTRLVLVGPDDQTLDPVRAETLDEIHSNPAIDAVGSQSDVRPFYAQADALVFPSYREGFPNVVIEAGAMGLPSIVTDINGSREIIIEGENGTIVAPRDQQALYAAMKRWVEHPEEPQRLAQNARQLVASRYEQSYVQQCLIDFYKQALESRQ